MSRRDIYAPEPLYFSAKLVSITVLGAGAQLLAVGWLQGRLCEGRLWLPCARHSQYQLAPMDPPKSLAEPLNQDGAAFGRI